MMKILHTDIEYAPASYADNIRRVSISGVQEKLFAVKEGKSYRLAREGEQSRYIIKPVPQNPALSRIKDLPVNEYLTMQIASKVFRIRTAESTLIELSDGSLAYMTRRFDVRDDGAKRYQEDFASLAGRSAQTGGNDYKYQGSYLDIANLLREVIPAWKVAMPELLRVIVFNYLFSNGDAHWKNFSVCRTDEGILQLTPMYDLLNTSLHIKDEDFALAGGLGLSAYSDAYQRTGHPAQEDFRRFAATCGMSEKACDKALALFLKEQPQVEAFCQAVPLSEQSRRMYLRSYRERLARFLRSR